MKLWEVLKELEENPMKVFEHESLDQRAFVSGGLIIEEGQHRKLIYMNDWQEVKQPVTWQEAIEAWADGKKIRCVIGKAEYIFGRSPYREFQDQNDYGLAPEHITKGTWYIED